MDVMKTQLDEAMILALERPDKTLWKYYLLKSCVVPPAFPILALVAWFRYHTMRYKFSDQGVSMSWGILFRREVILSYARIQDIHLRSNLVERWLGLARIQVQTASGSAAAEMTIEGFKQFEAVRDFLYLKMRGVRDAAAHGRTPSTSATGDRLSVEQGAQRAASEAVALEGAADTELASALRELSLELRSLHDLLEKKLGGGDEGGAHV
jgi:uncharacterized protein